MGSQIASICQGFLVPALNFETPTMHHPAFMCEDRCLAVECLAVQSVQSVHLVVGKGMQRHWRCREEIFNWVEIILFSVYPPPRMPVTNEGFFKLL